MDQELRKTLSNSFNLAYRIVFWFFVAMALWGVFVRYTEAIHDGDIYFSMAYGRQYLHDHTLKIDENQFSWLPFCKGKGTDGIYPSWIPHIVFYLAFKAMGYPGVYFVRFIILAIIFILFFLMARKLHVLEFSGTFLLLSFIAIFLLLTGAMLKADLFSVLFMAMEAYLLYSYHLNPKKQYLFMLPILFLLWSNSHIAVVAGLGIFIFWAVYSLLFCENRKKNFALLLSALASSLTIFITNKPMYLFNFIKGKFISKLFVQVYTQSSIKMGGISQLMAFIPMPVSLRSVVFCGFLLLIIVYSILCVLRLFLKKDDKNSIPCLLREILIISGAAVLGFRLIRTLYMFVFWVFFAALFGMAYNRDFLRKGKLLVNFLSLILLIFFLKGSSSMVRERHTAGPGAWTPVLEMEYIKSHIPSGSNILTTYSIGTYVMWQGYPDYRNYIDSRAGRKLGDYLKLISGKAYSMKRPLNEDKFDVALISFKDWGFMRYKFIRNEDEWKPVFWGQAGVVFVRKDKYPELKWQNPDFEKLAVYATWPRFTSRVMSFLVMEGHIPEAKQFLAVTKQSMPQWYNASSKYWELVFYIFESKDVLGAIYNNLANIKVMPGSIRESFLIIGRRYEKALARQGNWRDAYSLELAIFKFVERIKISLYNQGLMQWKLGNISEARRLLTAFKLNVKEQNALDDELTALAFAEKLLNGEEVDITSDNLL